MRKKRKKLLSYLECIEKARKKFPKNKVKQEAAKLYREQYEKRASDYRNKLFKKAVKQIANQIEDADIKELLKLADKYEGANKHRFGGPTPGVLMLFDFSKVVRDHFVGMISGKKKKESKPKEVKCSRCKLKEGDLVCPTAEAKKLCFVFTGKSWIDLPHFELNIKSISHQEEQPIAFEIREADGPLCIATLSDGRKLNVKWLKKVM